MAFGLYSYVSAVGMEEYDGQLTARQYYGTYRVEKLEGMEIAWRSSFRELDCDGDVLAEEACLLQLEEVAPLSLLDNGNVRFKAASSVAYGIQMTVDSAMLYVQLEEDSLCAVIYSEGINYASSYTDQGSGALTLYGNCVLGLYEKEYSSDH